MLELKAKENATVEVIKGDFPLGSEDNIKIYLEDSIIQQYMKPRKTGNCLAGYNMFSYGEFENLSDIKNINMNLNSDAVVKIVPGYNNNFSRCLMLKSDNPSGVGTVKLLSDKSKIENNNNYVFTFDISIEQDTTATLIFDSNILNLQSTNNEWKKERFEFTATTDGKFELYLDILGEGTFYIDNLKLFPSDKEVSENDFSNVEFRLNILNPMQYTAKNIDNVINCSEDGYIIMQLPSITTVDYQDNILCNFEVNVYQQQIAKYLGDIEYNKIKECVYRSEPFILSGYILPPDSDRYELTVGKI